MRTAQQDVAIDLLEWWVYLCLCRDCAHTWLCCGQWAPPLCHALLCETAGAAEQHRPALAHAEPQSAGQAAGSAERATACSHLVVLCLASMICHGRLHVRRKALETGHSWQRNCSYLSLLTTFRPADLSAANCFGTA